MARKIFIGLFISFTIFTTSTLPFVANFLMDGYRSATPEYDTRPAIVCLAIAYFLAYAGMLLFCAFLLQQRRERSIISRQTRREL